MIGLVAAFTLLSMLLCVPLAFPSRLPTSARPALHAFSHLFIAAAGAAGLFVEELAIPEMRLLFGFMLLGGLIFGACQLQRWKSANSH